MRVVLVLCSTRTLTKINL
uniref:Uncharacterized protein n=1 Tax=Rhizophora mucronata TaxID=61149 RepID=A0A2P2LI29_RHIMU